MGIISVNQARQKLLAITKPMIQQEVVKLVLRDQNQVLKKAKINEFEFGYRPSFKKIGKYRSDAYAQYKSTKNPLAGYGYVDLIDTGAFVNSLFVRQSGNGFLFDSGNDKASLLETAYGRDIFGLNQKTFNTIQKEYYIPDIRKFIKSKGGL